MTWFRVDDTLAAHAKARRAGLPAMGLWVLAGSYCGQQLTDGFVPEWFVTGWPSGRRHAANLVAAGLWRPDSVDGESGWRFHEWEQSNPTRAQVEADREKARQRQQAWRQRHRDNDTSNGVTNAVRNPYPDPTRPDPTRSTARTDSEDDVEVQNVRATLRRVVGDEWGQPIPPELEP